MNETADILDLLGTVYDGVAISHGEYVVQEARQTESCGLDLYDGIALDPLGAISLERHDPEAVDKVTLLSLLGTTKPGIIIGRTLIEDCDTGSWIVTSRLPPSPLNSALHTVFESQREPISDELRVSIALKNLLTLSSLERDPEVTEFLSLGHHVDPYSSDLRHGEISLHVHVMPRFNGSGSARQVSATPLSTLYGGLLALLLRSESSTVLAGRSKQYRLFIEAAERTAVDNDGPEDLREQLEIALRHVDLHSHG